MFLADVESFMPTTSNITLGHCAFVLYDYRTRFCPVFHTWFCTVLVVSAFTMGSTQMSTLCPSMSALRICDLQFLVYRRSTLSSILVQYSVPHRNASTKLETSIANHKPKLKGIVEWMRQSFYLCFGDWGLGFFLWTNMTECIVLSKSAMEFKSSEMLSLLDFLLSVFTTLRLCIVLGAVNIKRIQEMLCPIAINCKLLCLEVL